MRVNPEHCAHDSGGMTKREYAFWQCMNGLLAGGGSKWPTQTVIITARKMVDAGFAELNKDSES